MALYDVERIGQLVRIEGLSVPEMAQAIDYVSKVTRSLRLVYPHN